MSVYRIPKIQKESWIMWQKSTKALDRALVQIQAQITFKTTVITINAPNTTGHVTIQHNCYYNSSWPRSCSRRLLLQSVFRRPKHDRCYNSTRPFSYTEFMLRSWSRRLLLQLMADGMWIVDGCSAAVIGCFSVLHLFGLPNLVDRSFIVLVVWFSSR